MNLSIVTTLFKSENYIDEFYSRIIKEIKKLNLNNYEIIFVNDGSPDNSELKINELSKKDKNIKYIELSRNFGHHNAIRAGLDYANGEYIFLIDIDLEEQPEWLSLFFNHLQTNKECDMVYGVKSRSGPLIKKYLSIFWFKFFKKFCAPFGHEQNVTTARLFTSEYLAAFKKFNEKASILSGIFALTGFKQDFLNVDIISRKKTSYKIFTKINYTLMGMVNFSNRLLKLILFSNVIFSILSFFFSLGIFFLKLVNDDIIPGWSSLAILVTFSYTLISFTLFIFGLYISQIYNEVKNRPYYIIKKIK